MTQTEPKACLGERLGQNSSLYRKVCCARFAARFAECTAKYVREGSVCDVIGCKDANERDEQVRVKVIP